jgi:hypothetical protein
VAAIRLPPTIAPAIFTPATLGERPPPAPEWRVGTVNPWAEWLAENIQHRIGELLTETFDTLRAGRLTAIGFVAASGSHAAVPASLWASTSIWLDVRVSGLLAGATPLFIAVVVQPPAPKPAPRVSAAIVERFVTIFAGEMLAAGRRFSSAELALAAEAEGVGPSANVVTETLRRLKPSAWARRGRRSAAEVPTPIEIAAAARQAREAVNHR